MGIGYTQLKSAGRAFSLAASRLYKKNLGTNLLKKKSRVFVAVAGRSLARGMEKKEKGGKKKKKKKKGLLLSLYSC
jgi:hypothetical protein